MPNSNAPTHAPKFTKNFPTALSASKAAGIAAIRLSQVEYGDVLAEELNAKKGVIIGFRLHALGDSAQKITAVAVTQMGAGSNPLPLTPAQRSAMGAIADEVKQFMTSNAVSPSAPIHPQVTLGDVAEWFAAADAYLSCIAAIAEGGLNPLADAACVAARCV